MYCITSDLNNRFEVFFIDNEFDLGDGWLSISIAFFLIWSSNI